MRPIALLANLNDADLAVDATRSRLAEIAHALRESDELLAARAIAAEAAIALARCREAHRAAEHADRDALARVQAAEQKLYSGKIKQSRELEDAEQDLRQLRNQRIRTEDSLLEALIAVEETTARDELARGRLAQLTAEWEANSARLRGEEAKLKAALAQQRARQATARQAVPAPLLATYDGLRPRRAGRAVAELNGDECSACRVAVPPTKLEAARYGEELVYCGNCGRLIWGD